MPNESPLSAGLGRRLSEAADGFRDGLYHYFISINQFPFYLLAPPGANSDSAAREIGEAELLKARTAYPNRNYELFGPYLTPSDSPAPDYDSIEVRFLKNDTNQGSTVVRTSTFADIDTIFLTRASWEKFALPFYTRLYGAEVAYEIDQRAKTAFLSAPGGIGHGNITIALRAGTYISEH